MTRHFDYKSLAELASACRISNATHVRFEPDPENVKAILARKVMVGRYQVGNSIAIHPMEGCDGTADGRPDQLTWRRYERFARGGAKLIWFEATAVHESGRANTRQLAIRENNVDDFARLLEMLRRAHREQYGNADDLLEPIQLTHSGRYSVPRPVVAYHNPLVDRKTRIAPDYPVISDDELERLEDQYVAAGRLALQAGFRAVDLKATHGYLLSELLGARQREGRYGGALEGRTRFLRNVMGKFRAEFGERLMLCLRLGCYDGVPYSVGGQQQTGEALAYDVPYAHGFGVDPNDPLREDLSEVKQAISLFRDAGAQLISVSLGSPYCNPHVVRPFESPDEGNYEQPEHPLLGVDRHFRVAGELQRTFPRLPMAGAGYSWLQAWCVNAGAQNVADGNIRFFGIGRGALAYPDFARDALETGVLDSRRVCKTLTFCTFLMRQKEHPLGQWPTGCPPFDKDMYGPIIKEVRARKRGAAI